MRLTLAILCLGLLFASCSKNDDKEFSRYHEDGRAKPVVALTTVVDSSSSDLSWSLSEELSVLIRKKLAKQDSFFVPSIQDHTLTSNEEPFSSNIDWISSTFDPHEFVVFIELLEHETVPEKLNTKNVNEKASNNLEMSARIRVVDIRKKKPQIILQEIINDSYFISKNLIATNYDVCSWGTDEYNTSPMAMAHIQFTKNVVERIYDYVMLAKSR